MYRKKFNDDKTTSYSFIILFDILFIVLNSNYIYPKELMFISISHILDTCCTCCYIHPAIYTFLPGYYIQIYTPVDHNHHSHQLQLQAWQTCLHPLLSCHCNNLLLYNHSIPYHFQSCIFLQCLNTSKIPRIGMHTYIL